MALNTPLPFSPATRREFLLRSARGVGLMAFSRFAPSFLVDSTLAAAPAPEKDRTILVLVQLAGGNDGLNTLVPFEDADYYRLRPTLGIAKEQVLRATDTSGFHPACSALSGLFHSGKLAIVQNVGYPNPNRSHFRSTEIWETASGSDDFIGTGWIGRYLDNSCRGAPAPPHDPRAVHANTLNGEPETFVGERAHSTYGLRPYGVGHRESEETRQLLEGIASSPGAFNGEGNFLKQTLMDALVTDNKVEKVLGAYRSAGAYPVHPFGASLKNVAALIAARMPTRVYFVTLNGFDTHSNQSGTQAALLKILSDGLAAFQKDLESHQLDRQVITMTFSEFGRRASENESRGTDHGTASPLFILGARANSRLHGTAPSLRIPKNQDIAFTTDFRSVYATILEDWLECPSVPVLSRAFEKLPLIA